MIRSSFTFHTCTALHISHFHRCPHRDLPGMAEDASGRRAWTFTDLIRFVHDAPGIERIRFATSHPRYFTGKCGRTDLGLA